MNRATAILVLISSTTAIAGQWPQWRGPNQDGTVPGDQSFPVKWGEEENIEWKVRLPGWGTSTPALQDDHIFITSQGDDDKNVLICLDRSGDKKWQVSFGASAGNKNRKASGSNPSPVTDGTYVYAYYRNGDLACVDFSGTIIWQTNLQEEHGPDRLQWDLGTSPVLTEKFVVVAVMHQGPSYLIALDKMTGDRGWKQERDLGAPAESRDSYTTPLVLNENGKQAIVVLGADHVTAHSAATGEELWRYGGLNPQGRRNFRQIASPIATDDLVLVPYERGDTLTAIRRNGSGDISDSHLAWQVRESGADVPSPVAYEGRAYLCGDRGDVTCLDLNDGTEVWTERLPRNRYTYSSSPIIAGGMLYATREDGTTFVLKLADQPELVATNVLRENTFATPAFVDGKIFLRTTDYLFCIDDK